MPFPRPTLPQLIERTKGEIASRFGLSGLLPRGPLDVLGKVIAGQTHLELGFLDWIYRSAFPDTAEGLELEQRASLYGIKRTPPSFASGAIAVTGASGAVVPKGTAWRRADQARFTSTADVTLVAGAASVPVAADVAGSAGNTAAGMSMSVVSPIVSVFQVGAVDVAGIGGGFDLQTDESLRAEVLAHMKGQPAGGNANDYKLWALAVAGVTRVWVYDATPWPGQVTVIFATDDEVTGPIPTQADIDAVAFAIALVRPLGAEVFVIAPLALAQAFTIHISPDTADQRTLVTAALVDLFRRDGSPGGTLLFSHVLEAVGTTAGVTDFHVTSPSADIVAPLNTLLSVGVITWA